MTIAHISNYKSHILNKKKKRGPKKQVVQAAAEGSLAVTAAPAKAGIGNVSLEDIQAVKDLVSKVGEANLKTLGV